MRHVQRFRDARRDVGLHLEDVAQLGVERLLPLRRPVDRAGMSSGLTRTRRAPPCSVCHRTVPVSRES